MPGPRYVGEFEFPEEAGFSGSAGIQHVRGYRRGGRVKSNSPARAVTKQAKQAKVGRVMGEFKKGKLRSDSKHGPMVKNPKQAMAIALSEAGLSRKKKRTKKAGGGRVEPGPLAVLPHRGVPTYQAEPLVRGPLSRG